MSDLTILFEDEGFRPFLPLSYTRPVYDIRCGIWTLRERVSLLSGSPPAAICRPHLALLAGSGRWPLALLGEGRPIQLINGRAYDVGWLPRLQQASLNTVFVAPDGPALLGARLSPTLASAIWRDLLEQRVAEVLHELARFAKVIEIPDAPLLMLPWHIILRNGEQITRDAAQLTALGWQTAAQRLPDAPQLVIHNPEHVYLHPNARLDGAAVFDAREGPVVVDAARIEPFSLLQGPTAIGNNALISSARLRPGTTIGPTCRIGGEVEMSVVQSYTNKHHEGFLGHAYLGEWVNIGAMTTNSDLKNTYGSIKMTIDGQGQVDSGQIKLGCFLADHVKLGIGMHLNGGSMIGTGSNLFGVHFIPKTVPPFTWGGEFFREYEIDRMIAVSRKVMGRRKLVMDAVYETMLREVFAMTRPSRSGLIGAIGVNETAVEP